MYFVHIYVDFWKDSEKNKHLSQTLKSQIVFLHRFRDSREYIDHRATPKKTISLSLDYFPTLRLNYDVRVVDESRTEFSWKECGRIKEGEG